MNALIDTCVIVDVLQKRQPFFDDSLSLLFLHANQKFNGFLSAKAITDIFYLSHKLTHSSEKTYEIIKTLCSAFDLLDTTAIDIQNAISERFSDFEDGVRIETALRSKMDCIITQNLKDYAKSPVPVYSPKEFLSLRKDQ